MRFWDRKPGVGEDIGGKRRSDSPCMRDKVRLLAGEIQREWKILDSSLYFISGALTIFLALFSLFAGELANVSCMGFEVIFPFYAAVAAGEWGKIRADDNIELIVSQCRSVYTWITARYIAVMSVVNLFAAAGMILVSVIRREMSLIEMLFSYFPTAFLLSSLSVLVGIFSRREHMATMACGILWLAELMMQSLLRIPIVQYFYLFSRFAGLQDDIWIVNKGILCVIGFVIWRGLSGVKIWC